MFLNPYFAMNFNEDFVFENIKSAFIIIIFKYCHIFSITGI